jgi:Protein of unknown function (DUF1761)
MIRNNMNYLAILIAAVAAWIFGGVYYGVLGNAWLAAVGDPPSTSRGLVMVMSFVSEIVMAWVLSGMVGRLGAEQVTPKNAIIYAVSGWLGFIMVALTVNYGYAGRAMALFAIDGGHWLGVTLIMGAVIGWMGARAK